MVFFLQHPLKDQLVAVDAALALGRAEGAVAPGLEELLHRQGLGVDAAPDPAPALAPGQTFAGRHDVPADGLAPVRGLEVEMARSAVMWMYLALATSL